MAYDGQLSLFNKNDFHNNFQALMRMIPANESDYATHNIHAYPAKFLPHFPRLFIEQYTKQGELVVDPMCGSGTTLIESCLLGRRSYGSDIDPIAALISRVSVTPLLDEELRDFERQLFVKLEIELSAGAAEDVELPSEEDYPNFGLWFREDVLKELLLIKRLILESDASNALKDFGLLCLSSIVRPTSNADPRDIFPERDHQNPIRERKEITIELRRSFYDNRNRVADFTSRVDGQNLACVRHGDARSIQLQEDTVDLVFTSPPYAYAMDYARVHQLSTLLLIMGNNEFRDHRRMYIGTDRISVKEPLGEFTGFEFAENDIRDIHAKERKLGVILYNYLRDMHAVSQECKRVLRPGGHLIFVVGNSTVRGTHFGTDDIFIGICEGLGFRIAELFTRPYYAYRMSRKRNTQSNTIKNDVFIVAQKPST